MPKKKMTLKEFTERYECCCLAAGVRLKKLKEEQQLLAAKQREISEKIRQTENSLFIQRNEKIAAAVFKALGREYMPCDEVRIYEYLAGCDDFKIYMNSKTEETEEENCV